MRSAARRAGAPAQCPRIWLRKSCVRSDWGLRYKLFAEIAQTLDAGIKTQKAKQIDDIYKKYNSRFDGEEEFRARIEVGISTYITRDECHVQPLLKVALVQTIILAMIGIESDEGFAAETLAKFTNIQEEAGRLSASFSELAQALSDPEAHPQFDSFVKACGSATNTENNRWAPR